MLSNVQQAAHDSSQAVNTKNMLFLDRHLLVSRSFPVSASKDGFAAPHQLWVTSSLHR